RLACEPGGCSAPVAGYSACLTSFTSSIRFSLHAYIESYGNGFNQLLNPCLSNKSRKEQLYIPGFSAHNLNGGA
ncbi:hypothetical protein, partial [Escherichia coli]|uniref:hypothetical protein n=1 Tax=Escherichia coli TaxID=562 RepID=UPI001BD336C0